MNEENKIRKNSLMFHNGIGGLWTNNSDETFIIKAPKFWNWENGTRGEIIEENLRSFLGVRTILFPPGAKDKQIPLINGSVALGRFPGWHRCKGWRKVNGKEKRQPCGAMIHLKQSDQLPFCTDPQCTGYKMSLFAPVRFMTICSNGHLDDFPFQEWVHNDSNIKDHRLRYITTSGSGLSGIIIKCETCSSELDPIQRNMSGALSPESFERKEIKCSGRRPWLDDDHEECHCDTLTGVQKSSSNLLFPIIRNSIFCPSNDPLPNWIKEWIDDKLPNTRLEKLLPSFKTKKDPLLEIIKIFHNSFTPEKQLEIESKIDEIRSYLKPTKEEDPFKDNGYQGIFQREYDRFLNFPEDKKLDDFTIKRPDINEYTEWLRKKINSIGLLEKLRDTRVYAGFSRINPQNEVTMEVINKCYGRNEAVGDIVRGEGIFLEFNGAEMRSWTVRTQVKERFSKLTDNKREELLSSRFINTEEQALSYMLLHSLSHAIIGEISIFSGYNTASIRERIYIGNDGKKGEMFGILIYTSDGDSEGSLGGLVRLGKPGIFEKIFEQAIRRASWCSSDPLCSHSIPKGNNGSNLAACHHCLLLPETSCEARNEYLDREMIISENIQELGYFKK